MFEYEEEIHRFAEALQGFIDKFNLPSEWFVEPDHLAIKCVDGLDYVYKMEELMPDATQASEIVMDNRRLGAIQLISPVTVGNLGDVRWLEVMEPRPEKVGQDVVGLEHIEFYFPEFDKVKQTLDKHKIPYDMQSNPGHSWINIVINDIGQELKLSDKLLGETVNEEIEQGISRLL